MYLPSKHKDVVTTLWQRQAIGCIDVGNSLETDVSPTPLDNFAAKLRSDVVRTLW